MCERRKGRMSATEKKGIEKKGVGHVCKRGEKGEGRNGNCRKGWGQERKC